MNCETQLSALPSENEECYLHIDLTNPKNVFDFNALSVAKPIPESDLCLTVEPPQKLSELKANKAPCTCLCLLCDPSLIKIDNK